MINEYHNAIRKHIEKEKKRLLISDSVIAYQTEEDELHDHTLISQRIYKSRMYHDVVRVCLGLSFPHEQTPMGIFIFPTLQTLLHLKKKYYD